MFKISVVEDRQADADLLSSCIERYADEHGIAFSIERIGSAMGLDFGSRTPDLVFLDVEMPGISGMDAAQLIRGLGLDVPIIFVTNLAQYAIRGYEVDALDFIVKPVSYEAVARRMDKAVRVMRQNSLETVQLKTRGGAVLARIDDILYMESRGHNVEYHLSDGGMVAVRESLASTQEKLADAAIVRINKGTLVNMKRIRSVHGKELLLDDGTSLLFGRTMKAAAMETIMAYIGGGS